MRRSKFLALSFLAVACLTDTDTTQAQVVVDALPYSTYASVSGRLIHYSTTGYQDAQLAGPTDIRAWDTSLSSAANQIASSTWSIGGGNDPTAHDETYNLVTGNDAFNFTFSGEAQVLGTALKAKIATSDTDPENNGVSSSLSASSSASLTDQWLIEPTSTDALGTLARVRVSFSVDGNLSGNSFSQVTLQSYFFDATNTRQVSRETFTFTENGASTFMNGSALLLYEYGTPFTFSAILNVFSSDTGGADFFNTAKFTGIELPIGATLSSGALQSGIFNATYGVLANSNSPDLLVSSVPEPEVYASLMMGLALVSVFGRKRRLLSTA